MQYKRADRVAVLIKEEISKILLKDAKDPQIGFVTITKVKLSSDLKHAKIYYSVLGDEQKKEQAGEALNRLTSFVRSEIAHRVRLRFVPTIQFFFDDSLEYADRINKIINKLHDEDNIKS